MANAENHRGREPGFVRKFFKEFGIRELMDDIETGRVVTVAEAHIGDTTKWMYLMIPRSVPLGESDSVKIEGLQGAYRGELVGEDGVIKGSFGLSERLVDEYTHTQVLQRLREKKAKNNSDTQE